MGITYTDHARMRMRQRDIAEKDTEMVLSSPNSAFSSFGGRKCLRKTIGDKTLEVVFVKENDQTVLVTAYWLEGD
jgi:hypothetical protein